MKLKLLSLTLLLNVFNIKADTMFNQHKEAIVVLNDQERDLINAIQLGGIYQHSNGSYYEVLAIGRYTEGLELFVCYRDCGVSKSFGERPVWFRSLKAFLEEVEINGEKRPRFMFKYQNIQSAVL